MTWGKAEGAYGPYDRHATCKDCGAQFTYQTGYAQGRPRSYCPRCTRESHTDTRRTARKAYRVRNKITTPPGWICCCERDPASVGVGDPCGCVLERPAPDLGLVDGDDAI